MREACHKMVDSSMLKESNVFSAALIVQFSLLVDCFLHAYLITAELTTTDTSYANHLDEIAMTRMPEQGSTVVLGEAEKRASSKAFALLSQIKYVLDMNNRTMEFVAEVEGQLEEYFRKIGEEVRRKQENIRAEFDNLTETKKKIERLIEMTDHELEEVRTRGVKLERFYIANLHTLNTFLAEELTKQEARVFILDGYHVVDEHENTMESS